MARKINFTDSEKQWLIQLLDQRLFQYDNSKDVPERIIEMAKICRTKLLENGTVFFSPKQTALCTGCVNEMLAAYYQGLTVTTAYDLLHLSAEQTYLTSQIDMGKDMLIKLGYDQRTRFPHYNYQVRYRRTLEAIGKIRHAKTICLSKTDDHVYKIGFVTGDQEVFTCELSHDLGIHDISTYAITDGQVNNYCKGFTMTATRVQAVDILNRYAYPNDQASAFFKALLN